MIELGLSRPLTYRATCVRCGAPVPDNLNYGAVRFLGGGWGCLSCFPPKEPTKGGIVAAEGAGHGPS